MNLYIVHELEVSGEASLAEMRVVVRQTSASFARALAPVGSAKLTSVRAAPLPAAEPADADLAAFVAEEVCRADA